MLTGNSRENCRFREQCFRGIHDLPFCVLSSCALALLMVKPPESSTSIYGIYLRVISAQHWLGKKILHARVNLKCIFGSYIIILRCRKIV